MFLELDLDGLELLVDPGLPRVLLLLNVSGTGASAIAFFRLVVSAAFLSAWAPFGGAAIVFSGGGAGSTSGSGSAWNSGPAGASGSTGAGSGAVSGVASVPSVAASSVASSSVEGVSVWSFMLSGLLVEGSGSSRPASDWVE